MRTAFGQLLRAALDECDQRTSFWPLLHAIRECLEAEGIYADRIQLPMTHIAGLRHPRLWGILLTWTRDPEDEQVWQVTHEDRRANFNRDSQVPQDTPFTAVLERPDEISRINLTTDELKYSVLRSLRDSGYVDYRAFAIPLPANEYGQAISIASKRPLPETFDSTVTDLKDLFGLALSAGLNASRAKSVARSYLGRGTGVRVLSGEISRGQTVQYHCGIMFCDIRGFTAMTQALGGQAVVPVINDLFTIIGTEAETRGGEILKFIGDAMLIIFALETRDEESVATAMAQTITAATEGVQRWGATHSREIGVGFGCHIGEVVYGNIGTPERLDFTVIGPAVNLASRLESLTKEEGQTSILSNAIARHLPTKTRALGTRRVKGIDTPVEIFTLQAEPFESD